MKHWKFIGSEQINFISEEEIEAYSRKSGADIICFMPKETDTFLSHQQIILNERYAAFGYWVTEERLLQAGGRNWKLNAGWEYELLIRLAEQGAVACIADARIEEAWAVTSDFYTDAYVLSRYSVPLREWGFFDAFLESCLEAAMQSEDTKAAMAHLEGMLGRRRDYWDIYQATQPFLILLGENYCYNVLNDMARNLAQGLNLCGKNVEILDLSEQKRERLAQLAGKSYQAVIGFQEFLSGIYLKDRGCYLADLIHGPKLELVFDHPFWFYEDLEKHSKDFYILTHDENYVKFILKNAPSVSGSFLLPPAGTLWEDLNLPRDLDVVFFGTYHNYRDIVKSFYDCGRNVRHMAARYLKYLRKFLHKPAEYAFAQMLTDYGIETGKEQFVRMMYDMGNVCQCVMYYYREKVIRTLLDAGIPLFVYGESWKKSPFADAKHLAIQEEVTAEHSAKVFKRAKISLNVLAWHKGGCNERIINSMLAGAVSVTDKSSYIEEHFSEGSELCCYDLSELEKLPKMIKWLLVHDDKRRQIADEGKRKAMQEYSALAQAERVIAITEKIAGNDMKR